MICRLLCLVPALAFAAPALGDGVRFSAGTGVISLHANEIVYEGSDRISQLIWSTEAAPLLTAELSVALPDGWRFGVRGSLATSGVSQMADYDWLEPHAPSFAFEDWSDRSQHPDTRLDFYLAGRMALSRNLASSGGVTISASGGARYTDVRWTSRGGSYLYSESGFRDDAGEFPAGEPIISYEQRLPVGFVSLDASAQSGAWTFTGGGELGLALTASDIDNHWLRDLLFIDSFAFAPVLALSGSAAYALSDGLDFTASASFEQMLTVRGDTEMFSGTDRSYFPDGAGADFRALTLRAGLTGHF